VRSLSAPKSAAIAPGRIPLVGHLPHLAIKRLDFLQSIRKHGEIVKIFTGTRPIYILNSPEAVYDVLVTQSAKFSKGLLFDVARPFIGNGIITSDRDFHKRQRRALQPAFHRDSIARYVDTMVDIADEQVSSWRPGEVMPMDQTMRRMMTVMLVATLFSAERLEGAAAMAELGERVADHLATLMRGVFVGTVLPAPIATSRVLGHRRYLTAAAALRELADTAVRQARRDPADRGDLLSIMFAGTPDNPQGMSDVEARDELLSTLLAGAETTSTTLSWALYEIGRNPEMGERIRAEYDDKPPGTPLSASSLPFTDRFLREVLRLHQPNWLLMRRASEPVSVRGVELAEGSEMIYSAAAMHRDPTYFPEPLRFDPDRWLVDMRKEIPPGAYIPFAVGNRKCIGDSFAMAEMMVVLCSIVSRWHLRPVETDRVRPLVQAQIRPSSLRMRVSPLQNRCTDTASRRV
jgi:cytochrome P450